jgi:hypothetical protein
MSEHTSNKWLGHSASKMEENLDPPRNEGRPGSFLLPYFITSFLICWQAQSTNDNCRLPIPFGWKS